MSVTVNKFDFDQYPDNATTSVDEGFIIKTSISDIATESNSQTFAGVSLKFCLFIPRIEDVCTGPMFCMAKVKFSQNVPVNANRVVLTWNKNFDMQAYQNEFGLSDTGLNFSFEPHVFWDQAGTVTGLLGSVILWWQMTGTDAQFKLSIPNIARECFPCSSYGLIFSGWQPLGCPLNIVKGPLDALVIKTGDLKEGYSLCVAADADLPSRVKQMFPASWVTP